MPSRRILFCRVVRLNPSRSANLLHVQAIRCSSNPHRHAPNCSHCGLARLLLLTNCDLPHKRLTGYSPRSRETCALANLRLMYRTIRSADRWPIRNLVYVFGATCTIATPAMSGTALTRALPQFGQNSMSGQLGAFERTALRPDQALVPRMHS